MAAQHAEVKLRFGRRRRAEIRVEVTPGGLLAIGGMVGIILTTTAVLVRTAARGGRTAALPPAPRPRLTDA